VGGAERHARIDHWNSKWEIEQHIRKLKLPATIIRPASFMENYCIPGVEKALLKGRLIDPVKADKPYQTIATEDIDKFVALAFARPEEFFGTELEIAGSELTNRQATEVFARVLDRPVKFRRLPMAIVRVGLGKKFFQMFRWFNDSGYQADVISLRNQYPELGLLTLEDWLREEGWQNKRTITVKRDKIGRPLSQSLGELAADGQPVTRRRRRAFAERGVTVEPSGHGLGVNHQRRSKAEPGSVVSRFSIAGRATISRGPSVIGSGARMR
jgi:hypothetical protein